MTHRLTLAEVAAAPDCFLSLKRTAEVLGVSTRTLRRMIAAGLGPQVTQLSVRRLGIRQSNLREWLDRNTDNRRRA